jgi:hypothetical protein
MKKTLSVLILVIFCIFTYGQSSEVKKMLQEIEGQWSLDDNGNVTYQRIVEVPEMKKDDIYNRVLNYFIYNYGSGKSVIQTQDKENGLIVGKGLYNDVHIGISIVTTYIDAWHIVRVDIKDGKARIILTLTEYDKKVTGGNTPPSYSTMKIEQEFPINEKGMFKTVNGKAFYKSHQKAIVSLDAIEKAIKEGSTSKQLENNEW